MLARIRKAMDEREEGFTLIELLVVVIIIGILAAIAIPVFLSQRAKAHDSAAQSDLRNAATAEESFVATPGVTGYTVDPALLAPEGLKPSNNVSVVGKVSGLSGYCMWGTATDGTGKFFVYDSFNGGLQQLSPAPTTATDAEAACSTTDPNGKTITYGTAGTIE
jgi:type IV pilus assembly protein PilA